jgi:hypothetical protein
MSLLSSASVWTNEEVGPKKRQSTMKRPFKSQSNSLPNNSTESQSGSRLSQTTEPTPVLLEKYSSLADSYSTNTFVNSTQSNTDRSDNINNIINKLTAVSADNDGNQLADFIPISNPNMTIKKPDQNSRISDSELTSPEYILKTNLQNRANTINNTKMGTYSANNTSSTEYSNYNNSYDPSKILAGQSGQPYYSKMGIQNTDFGDNSKLLEKINYMIHLMEEQQNEKTANITEEFILYTFLGIFVIFIVDSFARSGKYVR